MTEQQLVQLEQWLAELPGDPGASGQYLVTIEAFYDRGRRAIEKLLDAIDERDSIIHDLQGEDAYQMGQCAGREEVVSEFEALVVHWIGANPMKRSGARALVAVQESLTGWANQLPYALPLPPDQVREENNWLRAQLREIDRLAREWHLASSLAIRTALVLSVLKACTDGLTGYRKAPSEEVE